MMKYATGRAATTKTGPNVVVWALNEFFFKNFFVLFFFLRTNNL